MNANRLDRTNSLIANNCVDSNMAAHKVHDDANLAYHRWHSYAIRKNR